MCILTSTDELDDKGDSANTTVSNLSASSDRQRSIDEMAAYLSTLRESGRSDRIEEDQVVSVQTYR